MPSVEDTNAEHRHIHKTAHRPSRQLFSQVTRQQRPAKFHLQATGTDFIKIHRISNSQISSFSSVISPGIRMAKLPGNGCRPTSFPAGLVQPQSADLVLKQHPQWFNQFKRHVIRQTANIMMRLNGHMIPASC